MKESNPYLNQETDVDEEGSSLESLDNASVPDNWRFMIDKALPTQIDDDEYILHRYVLGNMAIIKIDTGRYFAKFNECLQRFKDLKRDYAPLLVNAGSNEDSSASDNDTMSSPNGHHPHPSTPGRPRQPRNPADITHYAYADIVANRLLEEQGNLSSSSSPNTSEDSTDLHPGGLGGSQVPPPTEEEPSDSNVWGQAGLHNRNTPGQQDPHTQQSQAPTTTQSLGVSAGQGSGGGHERPIQDGYQGPSAVPKTPKNRSIPPNVLWKLATEAVATTMEVEPGPVVTRPTLPSQAHLGHPLSKTPRQGMTLASVTRPKVPTTCTVTSATAGQGMILDVTRPKVPATCTITSAQSEALPSFAMISETVTVSMAVAPTTPSATQQGGSSSTFPSVFQQRGSPGFLSVAQMRPFSGATTTPEQSEQSERTPSSASGMRRTESAACGIQQSTPDRRTGQNSRRSFPCSAADSSSFSPFTSEKAERLLGHRLAPELKRVLFAEAQMMAAESGNNSSLSASLLEAGRQVIGTEADESLDFQPAAPRLQPSPPAPQTGTAAQGSGSPPGQRPSAQGSNDSSSSSSSSSSRPEEGHSGVAQGGSHFATPRAPTSSRGSGFPGELPGGRPRSPGRTPFVHYNETSTWTEATSTFAVTSLAEPETMSPQEQPGGNVSPAVEDNAEVLVEPPAEFRGPILSLDLDAASPCLVLRDVTSSSNSQSQPHYPSANLSPEVASSDCYANSGTTTTSHSDLDRRPRQRYAGNFTVDRHRRSIQMRNRRLRRSREAGVQTGSGTPAAEVLTRQVEGAETMDLFQRMHLPATPRQGGTSMAAQPGSSTIEWTTAGSSTLKRSKRSHHTMQSGEKTGSSRGSSCRSHPLHHSTMIGEVELELPGSQPLFHSTMIGEVDTLPHPPQEGHGTDQGSVYMWSMEDNENLEESYLRSCKRPRRRCHAAGAGGPGHPPSSSDHTSNSSKRKPSKHSPLEQHRSMRRRRKTKRELDFRHRGYPRGPHDSGDGGLRGLELSFSSNDERQRTKPPRTSTRLYENPGECLDLPDLSMMSGIHPLPSPLEQSPPLASPPEQSPPLPERLPVPGKSSSEDSLTLHYGSNTTPMQKCVLPSLSSDSPNTVQSNGMLAPCNTYNNLESVAAPSSSDSPPCACSAHKRPQASAPNTVFKVPAPPAGSRRPSGLSSGQGPLQRPLGPGASHGPLPSMQYVGPDDPEPLGRRRNAIPVTAKKPEGNGRRDVKTLKDRLKKFGKTFHRRDRGGGSGSDSTIHTLANL